MKLLPWNLLFVLASSLCLASENATVSWENSGFEQSMDPWKLHRGQATVSAEAAHEGNSGLRIDASENTTLVYPPLAIDGLKKYRLRFWIRGVEHGYASAIVSFGDGSRKAMDIENADDFKKALPHGKDWQQFSIDITPPESAVELNLKIGIWPRKDAAATDLIDVDDFTLEEIPSTP